MQLLLLTSFNSLKKGEIELGLPAQAPVLKGIMLVAEGNTSTPHPPQHNGSRPGWEQDPAQHGEDSPSTRAGSCTDTQQLQLFPKSPSPCPWKRLGTLMHATVIIPRISPFNQTTSSKQSFGLQKKIMVQENKRTLNSNCSSYHFNILQ